MKKEDIHLGDWQRVFIGDVPAGFYWEVVLRIAIIYLVLMVSMRLMGKRMASQLSRNEMIAMVSLAAAIGVPLQSPDRGILAALVIAAVVIAVQQLAAWLAIRNQRLESVMQGDLTVLIADGQLKLDNMRKTGITTERAFAQLRGNGIRHLGQVKRLYFEASGAFTFIPAEDVQPGLSVLPGNDSEFRASVCRPTDRLACQQCGALVRTQQRDARCASCGSDETAAAVS
nr:YetF domain-containing protein [uncultured Dyadobacter sp.]